MRLDTAQFTRRSLLAAALASSVCGKGPTSAKLQEGFFDGFVSPMPAGGVRQQ